MSDPSPETRALMKAFDAFLVKQKVSAEDFLTVWSEMLRENALNVEHELVRSCIEDAADHLADASLDLYVSTK